MFSAQLLGRLPVTLWRHVDALALNRLGHERRHIALAKLCGQRVDVPEWHFDRSRKQWAKPGAELLATVESEGPRAETVKGMVAEDHP